MSPPRRWWAAVVVALALALVLAEALEVSTTRLYPGYDEISYLALGRQVARDGGVVGTVRCYLEGRCREDNRPPLYQLLLSSWVDDNPASFARGKVFGLVIGLSLIALVFGVTRRRMSSSVACVAVVALCLMPVMADYASRLMHDVLFTALTFAVVQAIPACEENGLLPWAWVGAGMGLAFLTKGSGHLLWCPFLVTSVYRHGTQLLRRAGVYVAALAFVAVSFFLLWRNWVVWRQPFHNVNGGEVWIDRWRDVWVMRLHPQHAELGLGWYLRHHSLLELVLKIGRGAGLVIGLFVYTSGVGFWAPAARVVTGIATLGLAGCGVRRRWRAGSRTEVVAVLSTVGVYAAALSLGASGAPGPQVRYVLPYVVLLLPYAALELVEGVWPRISSRLGAAGRPARWLSLGALPALLAARLALAAPPALRADPRSLYAVAPRWRETSEWLSRALKPGERFALPYMSRYSTWDLPRPDVDPRWPFWFGVPDRDLLGYLAGQGIDKVVVDAKDADYPEYASKLAGSADASGPLAFLGWPRCFADGDRPSRFLVFCRDGVPAAPSPLGRPPKD